MWFLSCVWSKQCIWHTGAGVSKKIFWLVSCKRADRNNVFGTRVLPSKKNVGWFHANGLIKTMYLTHRCWCFKNFFWLVSWKRVDQNNVFDTPVLVFQKNIWVGFMETGWSKLCIWHTGASVFSKKEVGKQETNNPKNVNWTVFSSKKTKQNGPNCPLQPSNIRSTDPRA